MKNMNRSAISVAFIFCALFSLVLSSSEAKSISTSSNKYSLKPKFSLIKSDCSSHLASSLICNSTVGYPVKKIKRLLARNKNRFAHLSGSVVQPAKNDFKPMLRFKENEIENMCRTKTVHQKPVLGFGPKMEPKYIVNVDGFEQIVEYELCVDKEKSCFGNEVLPQDFSTSCEQTYTWVRLLSVTPNGKLEYAATKVPSTCVCTYKREFPIGF